MKLFIILISLIGATLNASAQFSLSGKLRTLRPLTIRVCDLEGNVVTECQVESNKEFNTKPTLIRKDLYTVHFGDYTENLILTDTPLVLSGFFNADKPEESSMNFEGIDLHLKYLEADARYRDGAYFHRDRFWNVTQADDSLEPVVRATMVYTNHSKLGQAYEPFKAVLDKIPDDARGSLVVQHLMNEVAKRQAVALGNPAPDFAFIDIKGDTVRLSDFQGKLVLLDFSASWCGGCRLEARHLASIYDELKGDDLVILSISLDNREKDWRRMVEEDKLPWRTLWDSEGFTKGNKPNKMQTAYGFYQIPFIVLIDKEGKLIARDLRGDAVKEAIDNARKH